MVKIGIIGGSGLDDPQWMKEATETVVTTPYGGPSSPLQEGRIKGVAVVMLARHGRGHTIPPSQVNYRANITALKDSGCTHVLATTACGSLREEIRRGDLVILDQFIDFTKQRKATFHESFGGGQENVQHAVMADPFDASLREVLIAAGRRLGLPLHERGTVITIEGPRFSTRAESRMFRMWGADVINMSVATEAALVNELGLPYAAVAMSTDYDCWKEDEAPVTVEEIFSVFRHNVENIRALMLEAIPHIV